MPTVPNTFVAGTVISPTQVNANFEVLEDCYPLTGGELEGSITPDTTNTRTLGSSTKAWSEIVAYVMKLMDTDASHTLGVASGSNLTANRTLTIVTGDANRTLTLTGDATLGSSSGYSPGGTDVALADGGTGASLSDPGADRIIFWDESGNTVAWLTLGTGLSIDGTTINASSITSTDNKLVRVDGTTGLQGTGISVDDSDNITGIVGLTFTNAAVFTKSAKVLSTIYQAATDGFVTVKVDGFNSGGGTGEAEVRTDSNATPTTVEGIASVSNNYASFTVPVKKNDYYRVISTTLTGTTTAYVKWTANGTVG